MSCYINKYNDKFYIKEDIDPNEVYLIKEYNSLTCLLGFSNNKIFNLHRGGGPAIEWIEGGKEWFDNGKCHRIDGPAAEFPSGAKYWHYHNNLINCNSQKEFEKIIKMKAFL